METANFSYFVVQEMSREKDSAIIYELVTSKYKIAERNRKAKLRFLNEMRGVTVKRRDSEPTKAQTEADSGPEKFDLSVPGTPVSSRFIESLRKFGRHNNIDTDSENEDNDKSDDKPSKSQSALEASLKKFTAEMEKLQQDDVSHDPLQKYFVDSDKKKTYRRDFSEVVSEFSVKKKEPETVAKVERYFQESERMKSFKRDFTEVVQTFDPRNPSGRDQFTDLKKVGTPISSRLVAVEKLSSAIELKSAIDIKNSNEIVENDINSQVHPNSNGIKITGHDVTPDADDVKPGENENVLKIIEDDYVPEIRVEASETENEKPKKNEAGIIEDCVTEEEQADDENVPKRLKRNDSTSSNISIPGTPISSRDLASKNPFDTDDDSGSEYEEANDVDAITARAKEFVQEIENLVQKSFDDDRQEIVLEELKRITSEHDAIDGNEKLTEPIGESDEKLIIHEQQDDSNPIGSGSRVEDYFAKSERGNTYKRTFSEVENFNKVSSDVKQKVENYFKESEQKKSLTRPFSQAINYIEPPVDKSKLVKPGTPVSSASIVVNLKREDSADPEALKGQEAIRKAHDALHLSEAEKESFAAEEYFKQSQDRQTYQRNFSEVHDQLHKQQANKNPEIEKYFEQSDAQKSFQRTFSEAIQSVPPRIDDILKVEEKVDNKNETPLHYQRSSRASSISSNCSDQSDIENPRKTKKHGKKYGIDKYFATSLYRTAYHRSNSRRESAEGGIEELKIVEDEFVFGETDLLRRQEFQHDDETAVTKGPNDVNENQTVQFWRDFLKPYNLNLQTEIKITKDELLNNRTLE